MAASIYATFQQKPFVAHGERFRTSFVCRACGRSSEQNGSTQSTTACSRRTVVSKFAGGAALSVVSGFVSNTVAYADEDVVPATPTVPKTSTARKVFLDVSVDRKPAGQIVIELFDDVPVGSARFADLSIGKQGIDYRLSKFDSLGTNYITNEGVSSLSYAADEESPITGGESLQDLLAEFDQGRHKHQGEGVVSLRVKDTAEIEVKSRMVAIGGKLVTVEDTMGEAPNGTAFAITTDSAPDLESTHLVVGKVVAGMDVVRNLQQLPTVKANTASPFFMAAKTFGDKRADVAQRGFGKPFNRVIVSKGGAL